MVDTPADLAKLTVPQLKALCKERHLTGYSKLSKAALIQKLATPGPHTSPSGPLTSGTPSSLPHNDLEKPPIPTRDAELTTVSFNHPPVNVPSASASATPPTSSDPSPHSPADPIITLTATHTPTSPLPGSSPFSLTFLTTAKRPLADVSSDLAQASTKKKAKASTVSSAPPSQEGGLGTLGASCLQKAHDAPNQTHTSTRPVTPLPTTSTSSHISQTSTARPRKSAVQAPANDTCGDPSTSCVSAGPSRNPSTPQPVSSRPVPVLKVPPVPIRLSLATSKPTIVLSKPSPPSASVSASSAPYQISTISGKRFKPLVASGFISHGSGNSPPKYTAAATVLASNIANIRLAHLDFPRLPDPTPLTSIKNPLPIAQEHVVRRWAIILSGLMDDERRSCVLVSPVFRYAMYLSAEEKLQQEFDGCRLAMMKQCYPAPTLNWWPYLRQRQVEKQTRLRAYKDSFLANFYGGLNPLSERLWASPDNEKQFNIVLRFVQTRLWFSLSIGSARESPLAWLADLVQDAQEVVPGEIWLVTVRPSASSQTQAFYVLEPTCEVIGHSNLSASTSQSPSQSVESALPVRSDWSVYLASCLRSGSDPQPLYARLKWANQAEYDGGLSRHWLARMALCGVEGAALRRVAERYALACVVGNSVSGHWMSASQMAQDAAGLPERGPPVGLPSHESAPRNVNLFLPAHHHVESVHFTNSGGLPLHPALAVAQTPTREYFIMRDNGMQVGCEEDGVVEMWRGILGCDARGVVVDEGKPGTVTLASVRAILESNAHE